MMTNNTASVLAPNNTTTATTAAAVPISTAASSALTNVVKVPYTATMPNGLSIGKFPNPRSVVSFLSLGSNKEAQQFLSRGGQVIIRMRGLPYDASAKQVVSFTCDF